eukprot:TRINITY_DN1465_c0_g2_i1.p1 TRINITY_DN1465_c0_g2~~TRINITY_DN1465_c0_g2_i1.p1  ORF type:complete len:122 (+),score=14.43 TRINITY_DN1465_c0_g2_i1:424-789(+)
MVADLYRRFKNEDSYFNFPDIDQLTVFADNVLPCVLSHLGILDVSQTLKDRIEQGETVEGNPEIELRAAAVVACEEIMQEITRQNLPPVLGMQLDYYFWSLGKDATFRPLTRHANPHTYYY